MIEDLFGVRRSVATEIMKSAGAELHGNSLWLSRRALLLWLHRTNLKDRRVLDRKDQWRKLANVLTAERKLVAGRRHRIMHDPSVNRMEDMPPGISLEPGLLRIEFFGIEDLSRQLMELAQIMATDYDRIEAFIER